MQRTLKSVFWWGLAGVIAAEITFFLLKMAVAPTPLEINTTPDQVLFRGKILVVFLLAPLLMPLMAKGLQDSAIVSRSRQLVVGGFLCLGLFVHVFIVHEIFGKPRPDVLAPYEFSLDWFSFFTWGMGGMLIGLGLISLYSLAFAKRPPVPATA